MPAVALATSGAALLLSAAGQNPGGQPSAVASALAGVLTGTAIVLRPEAVCFAVAVAIASRTVVHRPTWRSLGIAGGGALLALLPLAFFDVAHFGSIVPPHVSTNAALVDGTWWSQRIALAASWFTMPAWTPNGPVRSASFWAVAPVVPVALLSLAGRSDRRDRIALWLLTASTLIFVFLSAPNDGGSQWGPRYLLFAYVPLSILAADVVEGLPRRTYAVIGLTVLLLVCAWIQRAAYRDLRGTKALYGRVVDLVERAAPPEGAVVSDVWWLDQVAAAALDRRSFLFVDRPQSGHGIVARLNERAVPSITVIRSAEESLDGGSWSSGTCYVEDSREELPVRRLVAIRLRRECAPIPRGSR
jgi:hypothetical protein